MFVLNVFSDHLCVGPFPTMSSADAEAVRYFGSRYEHAKLNCDFLVSPLFAPGSCAPEDNAGWVRDHEDIRKLQGS